MAVYDRSEKMKELEGSLSKKEKERLEGLRGLIEEFRGVQRKFAHTGAADTEPRCVFLDTCVEALSKKVEAPSSISAWQIFHGEKDSHLAVRELRKVTTRVIKHISGSSEKVLRAWVYEMGFYDAPFHLQS